MMSMDLENQASVALKDPSSGISQDVQSVVDFLVSSVGASDSRSDLQRSIGSPSPPPAKMARLQEWSSLSLADLLNQQVESRAESELAPVTPTATDSTLPTVVKGQSASERGKSVEYVVEDIVNNVVKDELQLDESSFRFSGNGSDGFCSVKFDKKLRKWFRRNCIYNSEGCVKFDKIFVACSREMKEKYQLTPTVAGFFKNLKSVYVDSFKVNNRQGTFINGIQLLERMDESEDTENGNDQLGNETLDGKPGFRIESHSAFGIVGDDRQNPYSLSDTDEASDSTFLSPASCQSDQSSMGLARFVFGAAGAPGARPSSSSESIGANSCTSSAASLSHPTIDGDRQPRRQLFVSDSEDEPVVLERDGVWRRVADNHPAGGVASPDYMPNAPDFLLIDSTAKPPMNPAVVQQNATVVGCGPSVGLGGDVLAIGELFNCNAPRRSGWQEGLELPVNSLINEPKMVRDLRELWLARFTIRRLDFLWDKPNLVDYFIVHCKPHLSCPERYRYDLVTLACAPADIWPLIENMLAQIEQGLIRRREGPYSIVRAGISIPLKVSYKRDKPRTNSILLTWLAQDTNAKWSSPCLVKNLRATRKEHFDDLENQIQCGNEIDAAERLRLANYHLQVVKRVRKSWRWGLHLHSYMRSFTDVRLDIVRLAGRNFKFGLMIDVERTSDWDLALAVLAHDVDWAILYPLPPTNFLQLLKDSSGMIEDRMADLGVLLSPTNCSTFNIYEVNATEPVQGLLFKKNAFIQPLPPRGDGFPETRLHSMLDVKGRYEKHANLAADIVYFVGRQEHATLDHKH